MPYLNIKINKSNIHLNNNKQQYNNLHIGMPKHYKKIVSNCLNSKIKLMIQCIKFNSI